MEQNPNDSNYDFDCPQFVDFTDLQEDDDNADEWFDCHKEDEEQTNIFGDEIPDSTDAGGLVSGLEKEKEPDRKEECDPAPANDMETGEKECESSGEEQANVSKASSESKENLAGTESKSSDESTDTASTAETSSPKKKPPTPAKALRRSTRKRKPANLVTSWDHVKKPVTVHFNDGTSAKTSRRSVTSSPHLKSTEQMEMEKIEEAKKALEKTRQMSQHSLQMVRASRSYNPTRSLQPPTKPHEFRFQTDSRLKFTKEKELEKQELEKKRKERKRSRAARCPVIKAPLLTASRKRATGPLSHGPTVKAVKTFALQVREFESKTPDRFHSKPVHEQNKGPCPPKVQKLALTIPKSPSLTTRGRKRPVTVMSTEEREEHELEEIKKYKFKATPVDSRIYSTSSSNTSMQSSSSKSSNEEPEEKHEFHARAIPAKMFEGVTGVGKAKQIPLTCPKSPAFSLKNRIRPKEPEPPKEEETNHCVKARPMPHIGVPFKPNLGHKATTPEPFSFAERDQEIQAKKEAKVQEIYKQEQEARIFHAQPLPDLTEQVGIPVKKVKPVTKPEPFNLEGETNGAVRAERWAEEVEKELKEQKKRSSSFRARPASVLYQEPFRPEKPNKPLTDISDFQLNTERRADEREIFERKKYEMEMKKVAHLEQMRQLEEEQEQKEIARLRAETVHKAQPIHHFKKVVVHPSEKPLTMPESPRFTNRRRSKMMDA